jgi:DNA-directed RNA polymerase specialized sigma24 family protein
MAVFVITADQVGSRTARDLAGAARDRIEDLHGARLALPADRTAGDEIQALTEDSETALTIVLDLTRRGEWSVGVGCGAVRLPLPEATREATGDAFYAARDAVDRAKKKPTRFALRAPAHPGDTKTAPPDRADAPAAPGHAPDDRSAEHPAVQLDPAWPTASDAEALIDLLLAIRARRSPAGWELYDLLEAGLTQQDAADRLGITAASVSSRARAADLRIERSSIGALVRLLAALDTEATRNGTDL